MKLITILVPAYNEESSLLEFHKEVKEELQKISEYRFEFLFVNDGSTDETLPILRRLREKDATVGFISLSANRGKEIAMLAGFDHVNPDSYAVLIMDADLQHPPRYIPEMLDLMEHNFDDVYGIRIERLGEPIIKKLLSKLYYKLLSKLSNIQVEGGVGDFRLLKMNAVSAICSLREKQRYTKGLFNYIGFEKTSFTYISDERIAGTTKWSFFKLLELGMDGILSFSTKPLRIATFLGIIFSCFAFSYAFYFALKTLLWGEEVQGFPTLVILILFLGGNILFCLGVIGEYIGKIFIEIKNRPAYFIKEKSLNHDPS